MKVTKGERIATLKNALSVLLRHVESNVCEHTETYRGGSNWTICRECGRKWADDKGGFKPDKEAPAVTVARKALGAESNFAAKGGRKATKQ